jgi:tellurite methyltransferase
MSDDALKWNERYRTNAEPSYQRPREFLIEQAAHLPASGLALDVAMGLGGNAGFLIERGLKVIGLDVSEVGARRAKDRWPNLMAAVFDLTRFDLPATSVDVVLNFYFLQRALWPLYRRVIRSGGVLIMETLMIDNLIHRPDYNPDYLLQPDELRRAFADWDVITYQEGWIDRGGRWPRAVASIVARRPLRRRIWHAEGSVASSPIQIENC